MEFVDYIAKKLAKYHKEQDNGDKSWEDYARDLVGLPPVEDTHDEGFEELPVGSIIHVKGMKAPILLTSEGWESTRVPGKPVYDYLDEDIEFTVLWKPQAEAKESLEFLSVAELNKVRYGRRVVDVYGVCYTRVSPSLWVSSLDGSMKTTIDMKVQAP